MLKDIQILKMLQMDGWMDGWTDGPTEQGVELLARN